MDEIPAHQERAARNEAAFRRLNENMARAMRDGDPHRAGFVCECSARDCRRLVDLTMAEYRQVRSHPLCFLVLPGHERTDVETVVEENAHYVVVQKEPELRPIIGSA